MGGDVCIEVSGCGFSVVTWVVGTTELLGVVWVVVVVDKKSYKQKSNFSWTKLVERIFIWILLPLNEHKDCRICRIQK